MFGYDPSILRYSDQAATMKSYREISRWKNLSAEIQHARQLWKGYCVQAFETLSAFQQNIRNDKVQVMIATDQYMGTRTTGHSLVMALVIAGMRCSHVPQTDKLHQCALQKGSCVSDGTKLRFPMPEDTTQKLGPKINLIICTLIPMGTHDQS